MPYLGGELAPLFDDAPTKRAVRRMAAKGGERMVHWAVKNTPVATGHLRQSWKQKKLMPVRRGRADGWESGVETSVAYAPDVEWGTGLWGPSHQKYEIKPKKPDGFLHWIDAKTGKDVFAKRVMHPGSPGHHMVAIAATMVEHEFDTMMEPILLQWKHQQEALV